MKLAIVSESPADEIAIRVLVESVLGQQVRLVTPTLRARGWPNVAQVLPAIVRHLHFNTDADGVVVVVDSDDTIVHNAAHDAPGYFHPRCRKWRGIGKTRGSWRATFRGSRRWRRICGSGEEGRASEVRSEKGEE